MNTEKYKILNAVDRAFNESKTMSDFASEVVYIELENSDEYAEDIVNFAANLMFFKYGEQAYEEFCDEFNAKSEEILNQHKND